MFPLGFMLFVLKEQMLQETEKPWNELEHWYQMGQIVHGFKYTMKAIHNQLFIVNSD